MRLSADGYGRIERLSIPVSPANCAFMLLTKLAPETRALQLATWGAGNYCKTRAEEETYNFYLLNVTDAPALESENAGLETCLALCLSELRKQLLGSIVPPDQNERLHYIAYLEKKAGAVLALVGDPQQFVDIYENAVVRGPNIRAITPEELIFFLIIIMQDCLLSNDRFLGEELWMCGHPHWENAVGVSTCTDGLFFLIAQ